MIGHRPHSGPTGSTPGPHPAQAEEQASTGSATRTPTDSALPHPEAPDPRALQVIQAAQPSAQQLEGTTRGPRQRFVSQMQEFTRLSRSDDPQDIQAARAMLGELSTSAHDIQEHLSTGSRDLSRDHLYLRAYYRAAREFLGAHRSAEGSAEFRRETPQLTEFQQGQARAEASLQALREHVLLPSLPAAGAVPTREQIASARIAAGISRELGEHETAVTDFRRYQQLLNALPADQLQGPGGHELLGDLLRFASRSQRSGDSALAEMAFRASMALDTRLPDSDRTLGIYQIVATAESVEGEYPQRIAHAYREQLDAQLTREDFSPATRRQRAFEQGYALLWLRAHGTAMQGSETLLTTLRGGGSITARFADALDPESTSSPADVLASLATRTPRSLTEEMIVRLGSEVSAERGGLHPSASAWGPSDPFARAILNFDSSPFRSVARLSETVDQLQHLSTGAQTLSREDLQRARQLLATARELRAEVDSASGLSEDRSLRAYQLSALLQADRGMLALRQRIGAMYGGAATEFLQESEANFASGNAELERNLQHDTQALQDLHREVLTAARTESFPLRDRIFNYRIADQVDLALDSGNDRVHDLVEWQALTTRATDADLPAGDRFNDLGQILNGLHAMRQRHYDERSLDIRDDSFHWGDLFSPAGRWQRQAEAEALSATSTRIQMSEADLTRHMTEVQQSMVTLLATVHPGDDAGARATRDLFRIHVEDLVRAHPGTAAQAAATSALPLLSMDGFAAFEGEPATQLAILDQLRTQVDQHLARGHLSLETLRDAAQTVRTSDGHTRPLGDFVAGIENGRVTYTAAYQSLSLEDQRAVIGQALHVGRLGEYRAALSAETDPVRRHFRGAMLALEEGNVVRGQAELQTFLRDLRSPGQGPELQPIADSELSAMRSVALDMNRRFMNQALDRLDQLDQEVDAQREQNAASFLTRDFGANHATLEAIRQLVNDPQMGLYSLDEALPIVRHTRIVDTQARFARTLGSGTALDEPTQVDLGNIGNLTSTQVAEMQRRWQEFDEQAYRGMRVSGSDTTQFGAQGLVPESSTRALFEAFAAHPEQALDGVPTARLPAHGRITFVPHRHADLHSTSMLRVEVGPEGGIIVINHEGGRQETRVFPPSDHPHYVLLYRHHGIAGYNGTGLTEPHAPLPTSHAELDGTLMAAFRFESYETVQHRAESPEANRQASLGLAQALRDRDGSYSAAARILEEVMADEIHHVQQEIPPADLRRIQSDAEGSREHLREEVMQRVFGMVDRGMPRPSQSQIDQMLDQAVQERIDTQVRQLVFTRIRDRHDSGQLDATTRQAWETYNNMMDPLGEWLTFSDSAEDRIADEVVVNLAFTLASGGLATGAGTATRAVARSLAARWLAAEGTNIVGERAALWAASRGGQRLLGRAALWAMGDVATESTAGIGARLAIWGAGVVVEGAVFHTCTTVMQSIWGYLRNGEWVFPEPGEFARGLGQSILLMGSMSVGNALWGRVAQEIGVSPQQIERMTEASRASRFARQAVHYTGQLATEAAIMTITGEGHEDFGTGFVTNVGTILQLRLGGRVFGALTGHALEEYQANMENRILQDRLGNIVQGRLGIDPQSREGQSLLQVMNARLAQGQQIGAVEGSVTRANLEALRNTVQQEFGLDPNTPEGQAMTAHLMMHVMGRAGTALRVGDEIRELPGAMDRLNQAVTQELRQAGLEGADAEPFRQGMLQAALLHQQSAEQVTELGRSVTQFLEAGGFADARTATPMRLLLLQQALASGHSAEQLRQLTQHAAGLKGRLDSVVDTLLGAGRHASPEGQQLTAQLLGAILATSPEQLPRQLEALRTAGPGLRQNLEAALRAFGFGADSPGGQRIILALIHQSLGEPGGDSLLNATRLAALANSAPALNAQIDLILAQHDQPGLRDARAQIAAWVLETGQTPEALASLTGDLQTGRRELRVDSQGRLAIISRPAMTAERRGELLEHFHISAGDAHVQLTELIQMQGAARGGGRSSDFESLLQELVVLNRQAILGLEDAAQRSRRDEELTGFLTQHGRDRFGTRSARTAARPHEPARAAEARQLAADREALEQTTTRDDRPGEEVSGVRTRPADAGAEVVPERGVFIGEQIQDGRQLAQAAGLDGNRAFLGSLAILVTTTLRGAERGFPNAEARRTFIAEQTRQARELAESAGQGNNAELLRGLARLVVSTVHGTERGFAQAEGDMARTQTDAPVDDSQVTPDFSVGPFPRLQHGGQSVVFSRAPDGTVQLANFSGQAIRIRWAGDTPVEQTLEAFREGQEANAESTRLTPGDTIIFADGTEFTVGEPRIAATEPIPQSLEVQRGLLAQIAGFSRLVQAPGAAGFFRSLLGEIQTGRLDISVGMRHRVEDIFTDPTVMRDLDRVPHGQRLEVRQALLLEILEGRVTSTRQARDTIVESRATPDRFPGYHLGGASSRAPLRAEQLPPMSRSAPDFALLQRYGFTQGVDGPLTGWSHSRAALEGLADPGQPAGPLVNLARRGRGALQTIYDRSLEISRLETSEPQSTRLAEARRELEQARGVVTEWEAHSEVMMTALDRGQAMSEGNSRLFGLLRIAVETDVTDAAGRIEEGGTIEPTGAHTPIQRVGDRVLSIDSNRPDEYEIADAWLDPARGDQGARPIDTGVMTVVVRERGDIAAVADAAQQTVEGSRLVSPTPPTLISSQIQRVTDANGQVRLEFTNPNQPGTRLVVRVIDQATARQEAQEAEQRFERAGAFQADVTAIPTLRGIAPVAPRTGGASDARPTARPPRPGARAETPRVEVPQAPRVPDVATGGAEDGTRPGTPSAQRRAPTADEARGQILPPPPQESAEVVIPPHDRTPTGDPERRAHINSRLIELVFPRDYARPGFQHFSMEAELQTLADLLERSGHGTMATRIRDDLGTLDSATADSPQFEQAAQRTARVLRVQYLEGEFSRTSAFLMSDAMFANFSRAIATAYEAPAAADTPEAPQPQTPVSHSQVRSIGRAGSEAQTVDITATGTDGERSTIRPAARPVPPMGGPPPPRAEAEFAPRLRAIAESPSPLGAAARALLHRSEGMDPNSPEFRALRADANALAEVNHLAGTETPFHDLATRVRDRLASLDPASQEFHHELEAYREERNRLARMWIPEYGRAISDLRDFLGPFEAATREARRGRSVPGEAEPPFHVEGVEMRLKDPADIAAKLTRRGWSDMSDFFDLGGARVQVRSQAEADAMVPRLLQWAQEHGYEVRPQDIERIHNSRGYRAIHVNVCRRSADGRLEPVAEIQIQTPAILEWGHIQHSLVYKNPAIDQAIPGRHGRTYREVVDPFCRAASDFLIARENGNPAVPRPTFDRSILEGLPEEVRNNFRAAIERMERLMDSYEPSETGGAEVIPLHPPTAADRSTAMAAELVNSPDQSQAMARAMRARLDSGLADEAQAEALQAFVETVERGERPSVAIAQAALDNYSYDVAAIDSRRNGSLILSTVGSVIRPVTVTAMDSAAQTMTLRFADGSTMTVRGIPRGATHPFRVGQELGFIPAIEGSSGSPRDSITNQVASQLHDAWRETRRRPDGSFEPRMKTTTDQAWIARHGGQTQVDIANTSYEDLPSDWQAENRAAAQVTADLVLERVRSGQPLDEAFLESASSAVHDAWLQRARAQGNPGWPPPDLSVPYERLPASEQEKDRAQVRLAIQAYQHSTEPAQSPPSPVVSDLPELVRSADQRQSMARAMRARLDSGLADEDQSEALQAFVEAVERGDTPSAAVSRAAMENYSYDVVFADRSRSGTLVLGTVGSVARRVTVSAIDAAEQTVTLRFEDGSTHAVRGVLGGAAHPFQVGQELSFIPAVAGGSGQPINMQPPSSPQSWGELNVFPGVTAFRVGRAHGQGFDPRMSATHCQFQFSNGRWTVQDSGSLNGTFVLGPDGQPRRLAQGESVVMQDGSAVRIGEHWYVFHPPRAATGAPPPPPGAEPAWSTAVASDAGNFRLAPFSTQAPRRPELLVGSVDAATPLQQGGRTYYDVTMATVSMRAGDRPRLLRVRIPAEQARALEIVDANGQGRRGARLLLNPEAQPSSEPRTTQTAVAPQPQAPQAVPQAGPSLESSGLPIRRGSSGQPEIDLSALPLPSANSSDAAWRTPQAEDFGGVSAGSHEGIGYKDHNEDRYVVVSLSEGRSVTVAIDGMGGHAGGERAAAIVREVIQRAVRGGAPLEQAIHWADQAVVQDTATRGVRGRERPGAVLAGVDIRPNPNGSYQGEFRSVGDAAAAVFDLTASGEARIPYRTEAHARGQTLVMRISPGANIVDQALGGHYRHGSPGVQQDTQSATLRRGQVVLSGSDGFWENFRDYGEIADIIQSSGARGAEQIRQSLMTETMIRQRLLQTRRDESREEHWMITRDRYERAYREVTAALEGTEREPPPGRWRYQELELLEGGNVIDPSDTRLGGVVGHFKPDNVTLMVQVVGEPIAPRPQAARPEVRQQVADLETTARPAAPQGLPQTAAAPTVVVVGGAHPFRVTRGGSIHGESGYLYQLRSDDLTPTASVPWLVEVRSPRPLADGELQQVLDGQLRVDGLQITEGWSVVDLRQGTGPDMQRDIGRLRLDVLPQAASGQDQTLDCFVVPDENTRPSGSGTGPRLAITDPTVSGLGRDSAFVLLRHGSTWSLSVQQTVAPVRVNGQERRPQQGPLELRAGDRIQIGMTELSFDGTGLVPETTTPMHLSVPTRR